MQIDPQTLAEELDKTLTSNNLKDIASMDQYDNCDLMQLLYGCVDGADNMPKIQRERFRKIYWEIFNRFAE